MGNQILTVLLVGLAVIYMSGSANVANLPS